MNKLMSPKISSVAEAIREFGFMGKVITTDDESYIESATGGKKFFIFCFTSELKNVTLDEDSHLIKFRGWWNVSDFDEPEIESLCNWYNNISSFAKLFRKPMSDFLLIEADLYVLDGISQNSLHEMFTLFINQFEDAKVCLQQCSNIGKEELVEKHNKAIQILHEKGGDPGEALMIYRSNSYSGFAGSQNNLGDLFYRGEIVPQNDSLAIYWFTRAAVRGEPTAYLSLAEIFIRSTDSIDALVLAGKYAILAKKDLPNGKNKASADQIVETVAELLDDEMFNFAIFLAESFKPLYEEKWKLLDAPGQDISLLPKSEFIN